MEKQRKYVVIDDDATNNLICEFTIRKFEKNASVQLFQDPEKALEEIKSGLCHNGELSGTILFLDINMPTMTGFEFLDQFQKFSPALQKKFKIYILTSSIEDFKVQAKQYPMVREFLSKPLRIANLDDISKSK